MIKRVGSFAVLVLLGTVVLAACGTQSDEAPPTVTRVAVEGAPPEFTPTPDPNAVTPETTEPAGGGEVALATTVDVEMKDIAFDKKEITIPANTDVTFNLVNNGAATHNFAITGTDFASGDYAGGQTGTLVVNLPAGEYEFDCTIPGHKEAGMVGKLIVTEGGAAASGGETAAETPAAAAETPVADGGGAAAATTVDVEMKDIAFDKKEITIPANTDVTFNLVNNGAATHNFEIVGTDFKSGDYVSGQTGELVVNLPAGEYDFDCSIPGHKEAGMIGKLIVVEGGAAAGGGEAAPETPAAAAETPAETGGDAAAATTVDVEMKDIAFDKKEITIPANTDVTFNLVNNGAATHNFEIVGTDFKSGDYVSGQTGTLVVNLPAGEYEFICSIPGHKEAGMAGKLIVQ